MIDGPSTAASVSRAHTPICHLYLGGVGGRDGACLCTHHQVEGVSAAPKGAPVPLLGTAPSSQPCTPLGALSPPRCGHPCTSYSLSLCSPCSPHSSHGHANPTSAGPIWTGSPLHPCGCFHNGGAHPVFGGSRHDCLPCTEPEGQRGGQLAPKGCPATPALPCSVPWPSLNPGSRASVHVSTSVSDCDPVYPRVCVCVCACTLCLFTPPAVPSVFMCAVTPSTLSGV